MTVLENEEGTKMDSVYELLRVFKERRNQGHETECADRYPPPHPATLGWRDLETGERFYVTLPMVRTELTDVNRMVFGNEAVDAEPGTDDFVIDDPKFREMTSTGSLKQMRESKERNWWSLGLKFSELKDIFRTDKSRAKFFTSRVLQMGGRA